MQLIEDPEKLGATIVEDGVVFRVWAPKAGTIDVILYPTEEITPLSKKNGGFFEALVPDIAHGSLYKYRFNGKDDYPDPASRFQPEGVHGPSMVIDPELFSWTDDNWMGVPQCDLTFYELHVGTFTEEGTFRSLEEKLPYLKDLGVTAIELMPVAECPGRWNWGYDPASLFAPYHVYGDPDSLRSLVNQAHRHGLAVYLDVIYNHLGPDGAYIGAFAPMFTHKHRTPWGDAINLDDEHSEGVRSFFICNVVHWLEEYHIDGLRLDAIHALKDDSKVHFLAEMTAQIRNRVQGFRRHIFAEDYRNINTLIKPVEDGGYGLDGIWIDDFHHLSRNITAGDSDGYYASFADTNADKLARTIQKGWYFDGFYDPATKMVRGTEAKGISPCQCVFYIQNHDQIGNRPLGNRLTEDVPNSLFRAISALLLFVPELPLFFMGQEWGSKTPFLFFTDHHEELGVLVSKGRIEEFQHFEGFKSEVPDPQDPETFYRSKLDWTEVSKGEHAGILKLYKDLLRFRKQYLKNIDVKTEGDYALVMQRDSYMLVVNLGSTVELEIPEGAELLLHTEQQAYTSEGNPPDFVGKTVHFHTPCAVLLQL